VERRYTHQWKGNAEGIKGAFTYAIKIINTL
jgi:hypothetical protein